MTLEWFDRVSGELQESLESICDKYDQVGHMTIDVAAKHPRIEFFVETDEYDRDYFCSLFFDPHYEEFYVENYDIELDQTSRTMLSDIEDILDAVHESFHDYMNDEDMENADDYFMDESTMDDSDDHQEYYEEINVEWTTNEVIAYSHQDEVEISYQFGIVEDTGDGILRRVNRIVTTEDNVIEDESNFIFSKEEASTIIAMIANNMDSLSEFEFDN